VTEPSWWLTPLGYLPWAQVLAELQGLTCTWADYTGLHETDHLERLRTAPPYSHVWGWSDDRLVRVRVDVDEGVVAVLTSVDLARADRSGPGNRANRRALQSGSSAYPADPGARPDPSGVRSRSGIRRPREGDRAMTTIRRRLCPGQRRPGGR
jgi:hypothetical protein